MGRMDKLRRAVAGVVDSLYRRNRATVPNLRRRRAQFESLENRAYLTWIGATSGATNNASHDYNNLANWTGGVIDDSFQGVTFTANTTLYFSSDRTTGTAGLNLGFNGNIALSLMSKDSTSRSLTLGGAISGDFGGAGNATVTLGSDSNPLHFNLGGVTRTLATNGSDRLNLVNVVSNGGLIKTGAGTLRMEGANTFAGGISLQSGPTYALSSSVGIPGNVTAGPLGTGTINFDGGSLGGLDTTGAGRTINNNFNLNAETHLAFGGGALAFGGNGQIAGGDRILTIPGGGTVTFAGDLSQDVAGRGLQKISGGKLILGGDNSYSGLTDVRAGTVEFRGTNSTSGATKVASLGALIFGSAANGGLASGTLTVNGGTLQSDGSVARTITSSIDLFSDTTVNLGAANASGSLTFTNTGTALLTKNVTFNVVNLATTFDFSIGQTVGVGKKITKTGSGTLNLAKASSYTGGTDINDGIVVLSNTSGSATGAGNVVVGSGSTLAGSGATSGAVSVSSGGVLAPGLTSAASAVLGTGNLSLVAGSNFNIDLNGHSAGTGYDQVAVNGTVSLAGSFLNLSGTRTNRDGDVLRIIDNDGTDSVVGTFYNLPQGAKITINGVTYTISYTGGTGNDVVLTDTRPPTAANDNYNAVENQTLTKGAAQGVLVNDTSYNGGTLTVYSVEGSPGNVDQSVDTGNGHLTLHADGGFTYVPDAGFVGIDDAIFYVATDGIELSTAARVQFVVGDASLHASGVNVSGSEGSNITLATVATFTDDAGGSNNHYTASINWGDGTPATGGSVSSDGNGGWVVEGSHNYANNGSFTITATVTDSIGGSTATSTSNATISNVTPAVAIEGARGLLAIGNSYQFTAGVSDPGSLDSFTYAWTITTPSGVITGDGPSIDLIPSELGTYVVSLIATDSDNASGSDLITFTAVDAADYDLKINFQPSGSTTPAGYQADTGEVFAARGNGYAYGWSSSNTNNMRDRDARNAFDDRYDTVAFMNGATTWTIAVPANTDFQVRIVAGDPGATSSNLNTLANGVTIIPSFVAGNVNNWADRSAIVNSGPEGRITLSNGADAAANRLQFVELTPVSELLAPETAPTNLNAVAANYHSVDLSWNFSPEAGEKITGFKIERKWTGVGADNLWREVGVSGADQHFFNDTRTGSEDWQLWSDKSFLYRVSAYNSAGDSSPSAQASIATPASSSSTFRSPYNTARTPWNISTRIEAENFDMGGEGVSFHDVNSSNAGEVYRNAGVDITWAEPNSVANRGYMVAWTAAGEWTKYTIDVPADGTYNFEARVSYHTAGGTFHVEFGTEGNMVDKTGSVYIPNTGDWHDFRTISIPVTLSAGVQTMQIKLDTIGEGGNTGNLDWIQFSEVLAAPANPSATAVSSSQINLSWDATIGATGYNVYRGTTSNGESAIPLNTTPITSTIFSDTDCDSDTTYFYFIKALDAAKTSPASIEVSAKTTSNGVPAAPTEFTGSSTSSATASLTWADNSDNEIGFLLWTFSGGDWIQVFNTEIPANATSHELSDLAPNSEYRFKISAYNEIGSSTLSDAAVFTTISEPPSAPTNAIVSSTSANEASISWTASSGSPTAYHIYASVNGGEFELHDTIDATNTSYRYFTLQTVSVQFMLEASNSAGTSTRTAVTNSNGASGPISVTGMPVGQPDGLAHQPPGYTDGINIDWQATNDATGYIVEWSDNGADWSAIAETTTPSYFDEYPIIGFNYYRVISYRGNANRQFSSPSSPIQVTPIAPAVAWNDTNNGANERGTLSPYHIKHNNSMGVLIDVRENDLEFEGQPLAVEILTQPEKGSVSIDANTGKLQYVPLWGQIGTFTFTYRVYDGTANSAAATVAVDVTNDLPQAESKTLNYGSEDLARAGTDGRFDRMIRESALSGIDTDGDSLTFSVIGNPEHGTVEFNSATGDFTYTPKSDFAGMDFFSYVASDGISDSAPARITITAFDKPIMLYGASKNLQGGTYWSTALNSGGESWFSIEPSGHSVAGSSISFEILQSPASGAIRLDAAPATSSLYSNGLSLVYTPNSSFTGSDTAIVKLINGNVASKPINIQIMSGFGWGSAVGVKSFGVSPVKPTTVAGFAYDTSGHAATTIVSNAQHGNVRINADESFTYEPKYDPQEESAEPYIGWDYFSYTAQGFPGTQWVQINVGGTEASYTPPPILPPQSQWIPRPFDGTIVNLSSILDSVKTNRDNVVREFAELGKSWKSIDQDTGESSDDVFDLATESSKRLDKLQTEYLTYLSSWLDLVGKAATYQRSWQATFDNITNNEIYTNVIAGMLNLPQDIGGLKPNADYLNDIENALNSFGDAAGIQVQRTGTIVQVANTTHKVLESAEYGLGLASGGTYTAATLLTRQGITQLVKTVAKNYVKDQVQQALLTPVMAKVMSWIPQGVSPTEVQAGLLALQMTGLLKKALPRCVNGRCFAAGTDVIVGRNSDGSWITKNIEEISQGDLVLSRDQYDQGDSIETQPVTQTFVRTSDHLRIVTIQDEDGNVEVIRTTDEHPFWVEGIGWTNARTLGIGAVLAEADGSNDAIVIGNTREDHPEGINVFNFEVQGDHTYFVDDGQGSVDAIWVHNYCAKNTFFGRLQGKKPIAFPDAPAKTVKLKKVSTSRAEATRTAFEATERQAFLKWLATNKRDELMRPPANFRVEDLNQMAIDGVLPGKMGKYYNIHHKIPVEFGGTNEFSNLIIIEAPLYHTSLTEELKKLTSGMTTNNVREVTFPTFEGKVFYDPR